MIIFLVIFSNVSLWSPKHNFRIFAFYFSCPWHLRHVRHGTLYGTIYCQKKEHSNAGFAGIPARYPIIRMSVSVRLRGRQISQIKFNLWMTRAYLYSPSCPNGIAFLNTVLLFVNNHGNCKMICLCVHIHQNGHQDSSTFKVMIEKLTVSSGPSQFCVTDLTFICKSHVRHRQSQVRHGSSGPSRAIFFLINV